MGRGQVSAGAKHFIPLRGISFDLAGRAAAFIAPDLRAYTSVAKNSMLNNQVKFGTGTRAGATYGG
jgi:hypothetical protein